jgi:hypothetical protein
MVTETPDGQTADILFDLERGEADADNLIASNREERERLTNALTCALERIRVPEEHFQRLGLG